MQLCAKKRIHHSSTTTRSRQSLASFPTIAMSFDCYGPLYPIPTPTTTRQYYDNRTTSTWRYHHLLPPPCVFYTCAPYVFACLFQPLLLALPRPPFPLRKNMEHRQLLALHADPIIFTIRLAFTTETPSIATNDIEVLDKTPPNQTDTLPPLSILHA